MPNGTVLIGLPELIGDEPVDETRTDRPRRTMQRDENGQGAISKLTFAFAAHRAVVDVDIELGLVKVVEIACVQDVGKTINPKAVEGQIAGGTAQGIGFAVMEEIQVKDGRVQNPSFTDYQISDDSRHTSRAHPNPRIPAATRAVRPLWRRRGAHDLSHPRGPRGFAGSPRTGAHACPRPPRRSDRTPRCRPFSSRQNHDSPYRGRTLTRLKIAAGPYELVARMEAERAPKTCAAFIKLLPFRNKVIHVRWSGESTWIPLGELDLALDFENHTSHPAPGEVLLYPGGYSETEILLPYGGCSFSSVVGPLAGNHFLTVEEGREHLRELGQLVLWEGAKEIAFELE